MWVLEFEEEDGCFVILREKDNLGLDGINLKSPKENKW